MAHNPHYVTEDIGNVTNIEPADPAAGANFNLVTPAGQIWYLDQLGFFFRTSAVVANRSVFIQIISPGGSFMYTSIAIVFQLAGLFIPYAFAVDGQISLINIQFHTESILPVFAIPPLSQIHIMAQIGVGPMDPADAITGINLNYRAWQLRP